jgi:hypothetical protein
VTLVLLAAWVVISLVRQGRSFTLRSRWSLVASMVGSIVDRVPRRNRGSAELVVIEHEHPLPDPGAHGRLSHPVADAPHQHPSSSGATASEGETTPVELARATRHSHIVAMPADPFTRYGTVTAVGVGMLHGIGAETPTQIVVLAAAAGAGGGVAGVVFLLAFLAGLFCSNSLLAIASTAGLLHRERAFPIYVGLSLLIATFSLLVGLTLVLGGGERLPSWLGG